MNALARGVSWIDLRFLGRPHAIATAVVHGGGTLALIDPGPSTCLEALDTGLQAQGFRLQDVNVLLLTHIHLDHAGAAGTLVRRYPGMRVMVHEQGAPHIIEPAKLITSASRLFGDDMDRLWGEIAPVPADNVDVLSGGERVTAGGRSFDVAYTPGHASHHVSYFDAESGIAFVGDVAGVCIDGGYVLPPTPPPDIDIDLWHDSVERIERRAPATVFLTHFGPVQRPRPHLRTLLQNLERMANIVRTGLNAPDPDEEKARRFAADLTRDLRRQMSEAQVAAYLVAAPPEHLWLGLARYWRSARGPVESRGAIAPTKGEPLQE